MAWRFKASKYKNAAPIVPKPEAIIRDICVGSYQTFGNNICASAAFMAFNWEHAGSSLAVLPLDDCGRKSKTMPLLHGHTDTVTDMDFSPFHDGLLVTGSQDCLVKVWHIPPSGLTESLTTPECSLSQRQRRVETVGFHPSADGLIHVTSGPVLSLWDLTVQQEAFSNNSHEDVIQSASWKKDGKLIATSCKDKKLRILDPRAGAPVLDTANSHQNIKDSRVVWLGEQDKILTTGFDSARLRQVMIRDVRRLSQPEKVLEMDCSTGILMPLYDSDTGMLFLAGKGDTTILYMEVSDREPYLIEGLRHSGEQTKGACLVPKRALRVMEGEVNRVLQLTSSSVVPIMYQVPRKTYRDYHADLYPSTLGYKTYLNAPMWLQSIDHAVPKMSLNPADRPSDPTADKVHRGSLTQFVKEILALPKPNNKEQKPITKTPTALVKPTPKVTNETVTETSEEKIEFMNVKDRIKGMERPKNQENNIDMENRKNTMSLNEETCKEFTNNLISIADETEMENCEDSETVSLSRSNSLVNGSNGVVPPKPLPRSSISEGGSGEDVNSGNSCGNGVPKPKPRTTQAVPSGYKPRLGPKPFSASQSSEEFSFDKVFSVPAVPGQNKSTVTPPQKTSPAVTPTIVSSTPKEFVRNTSVSIVDKMSPTSDVEATTNKDETYTNGKSDSSLEEDVNSSDSGYKPKTPSTAERRRMFEADLKEKAQVSSVVPSQPTEDEGPKEEPDSSGGALPDVIVELRGGDTGLERGGARASIAERRRAYEGRSVSVQEAPGLCKVDSKSPTPLRRRDSLKSRRSPEQADDKRASVPNPTTKRTSTVFGRVSKFRHLKGTPGHKSTHIESIKNISRQISGECEGFHANASRVAVPLSGGGGRLAILEVPVGATMEGTGSGGAAPPAPPSLLHANALCDWRWDPFCDRRLAVACDDGDVRLWIIPEEGLTEPTNTPDKCFPAHPDKIYIVQFHPTASDILTTAAHDLTVKIWDLQAEPPTAKILLQGHGDQIFAMDWSPCGNFLATVCKDGLIRVYKPRSSPTPVKTGKGPVGSRGARVVWALNGTHLVVTGFDKVSERQIMVFNLKDLSSPIATVGLDVSPAILLPHYDDDSSTLFLTGRGDSTIYCYEVSVEPPHLCPLSHHRSSNLHQGIAFLHKRACQVDKVEFAKALRLTNGNIEPLSFTVPRIKSELFQDDLFPPTLVRWSPTLSGTDWFRGVEKSVPRVSLQPPGMEPLSAHTQPPPPATPAIDKSKVNNRDNNPAWNSPLLDSKNKRDEILKSVSARMDMNLKLEQDNMEGVDDTEWE